MEGMFPWATVLMGVCGVGQASWGQFHACGTMEDGRLALGMCRVGNRLTSLVALLGELAVGSSWIDSYRMV